MWTVHLKQSARLQALWKTTWIGYAVSLAAVALVSVLIGAVLSHRPIANISMVYLVAVLGIAVQFGRGPAVLASLAAFLAFNWLFVEPQHTLAIEDPEQWIALLLLLLTGVTTGQLAAGLRERAENAKQREREAIVLYDIVRLMSQFDLDQAVREVARRLCRELQLAAVAVELTDKGGPTARAMEGEEEALALIPRATTHALQQLAQGSDPMPGLMGKPQRWVRIIPPHSPRFGQPANDERLRAIPIEVRDRRMGRLVLVRNIGAARFSSADDRLLSGAATQLGIAFERVLLLHAVTKAEVLRRTDDLKTALLNAVSHDLRTPLASVIASAASLRQREVQWTEEERLAFAEGIEEEALRLNRIVGNLLDLSRIEGGSLRPEKDWYDLSTLVGEVLSRLRPLTAQHSLCVSVPEDLPPMHLDYVEIDQVLSNLIENATKHTRRGTKIEVSARRNDGEVQIAVDDRGAGIPQAALEHLFKPFYRAEAEVSPPGSGLGLAVAKGLVEAHGGRIWAENRPEGGARFIFTLPLEPAVSSPTTAEEVSL